MDLMIPYGNKDTVNMLFSDKNSLIFMKISHSLKMIMEIIIISTAIYSFYTCSFTETQIVIYCFFIVFILLYFIKIIFSLTIFYHIIISKKYSDVRINIFNLILETLNNLFIFAWCFFGLSASRTFIISKYHVQPHLKAASTIFMLNIIPAICFLIISLIMYVILWYLLNNIPVKKFKDLKHKPNDVCHICLETLNEEENVKILKCKHYFHVYCCDQWVPREKTCPLCRRYVTRLDSDWVQICLFQVTAYKHLIYLQTT